MWARVERVPRVGGRAAEAVEASDPPPAPDVPLVLDVRADGWVLWVREDVLSAEAAGYLEAVLDAAVRPAGGGAPGNRGETCTPVHLPGPSGGQSGPRHRS